MLQYNNLDESKFECERKPEIASEENDFQENKYHGNLLLKEDIDKRIKKNIQYTLAALAQFHRWNDDDGVDGISDS